MNYLSLSMGLSALLTIALCACATVALANGKPARSEIVEYARAMLGTPYVWGGTSPDGFDCSGLVQYSYGKVGVEVPRTAALQVEAAQPVSIDGLRPGDLVFFDTNGSYGHVGIYVGHGKFIHAPRTGKDVRISTLDNPYWGDALARAGAFLN